MKYVGIASTVAGLGTASATATIDDSHEDGHGDAPRGTIEKLGQALPEDPPRYTYGQVREDGMYGAISSFASQGNDFTSSLFDLSDLENPEEVHRIEPPNDETRSNDIKFDGTRDGIYYRSMEADDFDEDDQVGEMGIEVIDYGYADGTAEDPEIIATLNTPNTGVHKLTEHPDETIIYLVDKDGEEPGVFTVDVEDPVNPEIVDFAGPDGYCHDLEVDMTRDALHTAYISGDFIGYVIFDLSDPYAPEELSRIDYADLPDYEEIGTAGFESCHQATFDPERDIAVVGDEVGSGIPGGKHFYDIGWDEGSPEDPIHIGFTHSPNAVEQDDDEPFFWTTHFANVVPCGDTTLLVDGGYHEGVWVADMTDPTNPQLSQQFQTREDEELIPQLGSGPVTPFLDPLHPPFVWSVEYNKERDFIFASDSLTGAYTFDVSPEEFEFRTIEEELAQTYEPRDEIGGQGLALAQHYNEEHATVPNTGGQVLTDDILAEIEDQVDEDPDETVITHH